MGRNRLFRAAALFAPAALLLMPVQAHAAFLDTLLGTLAAQTDTWMNRATQVALAVFASLAVIEFAWHGVQLVLKKGELSELFGSVILKVASLGFFYTLIVFAPDWIPLISQTFQSAGAQISGLSADALTPSGIVNTGIDVASKVFNAPLREYGLLEIGKSLLTSIIVALTALMVFVAFALLGVQMLIVKIEMLMVLSAGVFMLGMSGSRWTMNFAEKYLGYSVSVGARLIVISLLAGFGVTFGDYVVGELTSNNRVLEAPQLFSLLGTSGVFSVVSYMVPSLAGSFLSGAASMSLANTAAAGGSLASAGAGGTARVAGVTASASGAAMSALARLAAPAAAVGSILGVGGGGGSRAAGAVSGGARAAFGTNTAASGVGTAAGAGAGTGSAVGTSSAVGGVGTAAGAGTGGGGGARRHGVVSAAAGTGSGSTAAAAGGAGRPDTGSAAGATGASAGGGFADPRASFDAATNAARPLNAEAASQYKGPVDYRDEKRAKEKEFRARASSAPLSRALLKTSDRLKDFGDASSAFARRQRRPLASDGHTGAAPGIRLHLSGD